MECFAQTLSHLQDIDEDVLLWLLGAADIFQYDGVVDALRVWLVQVISVRLVPLLEGEEDLVLICTHDLNILVENNKEGRKALWVFSESLVL